MEQFEIRQFLASSNRHWTTGSIELPENLRVLYRPQYDLLLKNLDKKQILGLVGLRRVGKSVIMRQLMHFLAKTHDPKGICSLSFDEELVSKNPDILDMSIQTAINENPKAGRYFIFIDEIQFVKNWQHILKRYYDRDDNIKFIISGSSSLFIQKRTTESLAGRILEFVVPQLHFWEYLLLTGQFAQAVNKLRSIEVDWNNLGSILSLAGPVGEILIKNPLLGDKFDGYLHSGQFPEPLLWPESEILEYIKNSVYKKTLVYDIPRLFQIRRPEELVFVYNILLRESANLLEVNNLASASGINRNTISSYLDYLGEALLHIRLSNATSSIREQRRLLRKGYVPSPNFTASSLQLDRTSPVWLKEVGHLAETFVANTLWQKHGESLHFYRKGDVEIDFVISELPGQLQGSAFLEVKYGNNVLSRDVKQLKMLAEKSRTNWAVCVTRNIFKIETCEKFNLVYLPIWAM